DQRLWSVTTIIGCIDKPQLLYWSAGRAAETAIEEAVSGRLAKRIELGREECFKWLRDARFRPVKGVRTATERGTAVHKACEEYVLTGQRPAGLDAEISQYLDSFDRWCQV